MGSERKRFVPLVSLRAFTKLSYSIKRGFIIHISQSRRQREIRPLNKFVVGFILPSLKSQKFNKVEYFNLE